MILSLLTERNDLPIIVLCAWAISSGQLGALPMAKSTKVALPKWCSIVRSAPAVWERDAFSNPQIVSPRDAVAFVGPTLQHQEVELFLAISLNAQHRAIGITKVTSGIL